MPFGIGFVALADVVHYVLPTSSRERAVAQIGDNLRLDGLNERLVGVGQFASDVAAVGDALGSEYALPIFGTDLDVVLYWNRVL